MANNTCIRGTFKAIKSRFNLLYKRKAHLHHYTDVDNMSLAVFEEAAESLDSLVNEYKDLEGQHADTNNQQQLVERLKILS